MERSDERSPIFYFLRRPELSKGDRGQLQTGPGEGEREQRNGRILHLKRAYSPTFISKVMQSTSNVWSDESADLYACLRAYLLRRDTEPYLFRHIDCS